MAYSGPSTSSASNSIKTFKDENKVPPPSPKKYNKLLTCGVLTKSPLKPCKTGQMFTLTLCDEDPMSTLKGVCFDEDQFAHLEVKKTYDLRNCKIKKSYGTNGLEILIDEDTKIRESTNQFKLERSWFQISQVVRGDTANVNMINVKAKVITIGDIEVVGKQDPKQKRDITIADQTGQINIVLWRDMVNNVDFDVGDNITVENVYISKFNHVNHLTYNSQTSITKIDEKIEVASGIVTVKDKPSVVMSVKEHIEGYKEFKSLVKCPNCNMENDITDQPKPMLKNGCVVKCTGCSTTFLAKIQNTVNECKFLINDIWYTARKSVVQTLFQTDGPQLVAPTQVQNNLLLSSKYLLRLNINVKKLEHVECIEDNDTQEIQDQVHPSTNNKTNDDAEMEDEHDESDISTVTKKAKTD